MPGKLTHMQNCHVRHAGQATIESMMHNCEPTGLPWVLAFSSLASLTHAQVFHKSAEHTTGPHMGEGLTTSSQTCIQKPYIEV